MSVFEKLTEHRTMRFLVLVWSMTVITYVFWWAVGYIDSIGTNNFDPVQIGILGVTVTPITAWQVMIVKYYAMYQDN